jgi:deoxyribodipyrimidine photo-lyase
MLRIRVVNRPVVVWWVKRDARLADNACLTEAHFRDVDVLPFFCVEPTLLSAEDTSAMHIQAQWQAVTELRMSLREHGADVLIAHGEVVEKLAKLRAIIPFMALFCHEETGNALTYQRDRQVAAWCTANGVEYLEFPQSSVRRGGVNRDYLQRQWKSRVVESKPFNVPPISQGAELRQLAGSTAFPKLEAYADNKNWQPVGESAAQATLHDFLSRRAKWYRGGISSPNTAFTSGSRLSVHLAWGTITTRQIWHSVQQRLQDLDVQDPETKRWKQSLDAFLSRLHWRDHFTQRLESEPELEFRSIHPSYRAIPYENDPKLFQAWCEGRTGYPLVDAVMRCLATTGFVNFRMRAMVVSFACHVLHLDWLLIHPHLARVFRDYDPGIHLNQLQMQAGVVGWNAIRVYNPAKQLLDWDRDCRFVKRWLPELREANPEEIQHFKEGIAGYTEPIVTFADRAKTMSSLLYSIRKTAAAKAATSAVYKRHGSRKKETNFRKRPKAQSSKPSLFDSLPVEE